MIAIFDNDGTICDSQEAEDACFARAVALVTGQPLRSLDWTSYPEPTSTAIVRGMLQGLPPEEAVAAEARIVTEYVRELGEIQPLHPDNFIPIPGAVDFIRRLQSENVCAVGLATGCFAPTAAFKLRCCGLEMHAFPHATSCDTPRRRDIIPLAAQRAGYDLSSVVYFGDAPWDVHVSRALGIPLIGIGRRAELLRSMGVPAVFRDYTDPDAILAVLHSLKAARQPRA